MDRSVRPQIVLAEDNPGDVLLVRMALRDAGMNCDVTVVDDGEKAIDLIRRLDDDPNAAPVHLLLLDLHLPKRDGADVLQRLRSTQRNARTPVILMTGSDAPSDRQLAQQHPEVHYFRKSASFAEFMHLGAIVRGVLKPEARGGAA